MIGMLITQPISQLELMLHPALRRSSVISIETDGLWISFWITSLVSKPAMDQVEPTIPMLQQPSTAGVRWRMLERSSDFAAEPFNPVQTTVNLFLYNIRENPELRRNSLVVEVNKGGLI